jgi:hypothetical protein
MRRAQRIYLAAAAIALGAMVCRTDWIDWPLVGQLAWAIGGAVAMILIILAGVAFVFGVPTLAITVVTIGLLKLFCPEPKPEPNVTWRPSGSPGPAATP